MALVLILVAIGLFVFYKLPGIQDVPAADRAEAGRGLPLLWNFTYPNGVIAVDTLRAPVGQTTRLEVSAPDFDVIHLVDPGARRQVRRDPGGDERDLVQPERAGHVQASARSSAGRSTR